MLRYQPTAKEEEELVRIAVLYELTHFEAFCGEDKCFSFSKGTVQLDLFG